MLDTEVVIYQASECCIFRKTKEEYGGLSNMASGYPLEVNGIKILSSEALYQALKFSDYPTVQEKIILQKSPMAAKMVAKPYKDCIRKDWEEVRISVMRWCLQTKLAQNYIKFGLLLKSTGQRTIVEDSRRDTFWGAVRFGKELRGANVLGQLLMELREQYYKQRCSDDMLVVHPLDIVDFKIFERPIQMIKCSIAMQL